LSWVSSPIPHLLESYILIFPSRTYCLEHRTETAHICPQEGKWAAARRRREIGTLSTSSSSSASTGRSLGPSTCAHSQCKTTIHTARSAGVLCPNCKRTYCLPHRLQDSHNCSTLPPLLPPTAKAQATASAKGALAKFKAWTAGKSEKVGEKVREKRQGSAVVETLRLKREAKGDAKVPMDKRVWVYVEAQKGSTMSKLPKGEFFYSKVAIIPPIVSFSGYIQILTYHTGLERRKSPRSSRLCPTSPERQ